MSNKKKTGKPQTASEARVVKGGISIPPPAAATNIITITDSKYKNEKATSPPPPVLDIAIAKVFASIATNVWRSKNKIIDPKTGEPREEMKKLYRHIEAIDDALTQAEVQTIDIAGRTYDTGMALKVVCFEETPGFFKEKIKETVKPSVKWHGTIIQMGEVIIGTPPKSDSEGEKNNA